MSDRPQAIARLEAALKPLHPGLRVEWEAEVGSTNTVLGERAREPSFAPTVLIADQQTQGRGRFGRAWASMPGASLMFSLAIPVARMDWSGLSLAMGVAIAEALQDWSGAAPMSASRADMAAAMGRPSLGLKWPNDLLLAGAAQAPRKLGGILIEGVGMQGAPRVAVIGVGLNLLPMALADASTGHASLSELSSPVPAPLEVLLHVLPALVHALDEFAMHGFAPFASRYAAYDALAGRCVVTLAQGAEGLRGTARGVDGRGAFLLDTANGRVSIDSGEISVRLSPAEPPAQGQAAEGAR